MSRDTPSPSRRWVLAGALGLAGVSACAPEVQPRGVSMAGFAGPRLERDALVSSDGAVLPLKVWDAQQSAGAASAPWGGDRGVCTA